MTKILFKTAILLSISVVLNSCNDVFDDLAINPNQPSMAAQFTTPEGVNQAVATCYGYISTPRLFGANASKTTILRSDEASSDAAYGKPGMFGASLNSSDYVVQQPFGLLYSCASQACYVIENIDGVEFGDQELKNAYKGEAYFWRAFTHYYLLMTYRNVSPMRHMPLDSKDYVRPVESPEAVWDFIIEDLNNAISLLPNKGYWSADNAGRITAGAAASLKGKCYLYRSGIEPKYGESSTTYYNEAAAAFGEVINGTYGAYDLVEYGNNFDVANEYNDESVFEMQFQGDVINNSFNPGTAKSALFFDSRGLMLPGTGDGYEGVVHKWLYDEFARSIDKDGYTDIRMFSTLFFNDLDPAIKLRPSQRLTGPGGYKFEEIYTTQDFASSNVLNPRARNYKAAILKGLDLALPMRNDNPTQVLGVGTGTEEFIYNQPRANGVNWRYIRYADVLMMYAEAVVMGGTATAGSADAAFQKVTDRANMPSKGGITMDDIKKERILEFALEGHRFFDLLRWGDVSARFAQLTSSDLHFKRYVPSEEYSGFVENKHEWLPIPVSELESNPYAKQNSALY